ncbi:unnamed protein product [Chironomus riparius]|uniref:Uncharacterized protein n=1 Tax=Chironomus riparius TaxID=315576 RepID=A0A9N9S4S7_9DIPT|nr:unnamed protein product [Chironomus riparius]
MFSNIFITISAITLSIDFSSCANYERDIIVDHQLNFNRRSFIKFTDEEKLISYLSSFGGSPNSEESMKHMIYKRASGRIKKVKKNSSNNFSSTLESNKKQQNDVPKNFTSPKHLVKFELKDAKYSEEYEHLKKSRKLRAKRSSDNDTNAKTRKEKHLMKDMFVQPEEFFKFVYTDAIIAASSKLSLDDKVSKSEKKIKRQVSSIDSTTSDTRKIKIIHPLSSTSCTKHVSFDELPSKIQKVVESAISDAKLKGKANDGDYLKFYYGDKIIKVPVSLSKYISSKMEKPSKGLSDYYTRVKVQKFQNEDIVIDPPFLPVTKNSFSKYQSIVKYETTPYISEKAQSNSNFVALKENPITKIEKEPAKKSNYFYLNKDEKLSSPISFDSFSKSREKEIDHKKIIFPSTSKDIVREAIPITEDFNESKFNMPIYPTSYVEYEDNFTKKPLDFHEDKNYAFGYHVSDFHSGNNFGHTQTKNNKEIKGEYSILMADGRVQITKYFADDTGFHADVSYQNVH